MVAIRGFTLLLLCQMAGELTSRGLGVAVPGPVVGLVILFCGLCVRGRPPAELELVADRLLANLALLFVPAGVGVVRYGSLIAHEWVAIGVALIGSTVVTLAATATAMRLLLGQRE
jgi:holin-like protein